MGGLAATLTRTAPAVTTNSCGLCPTRIVATTRSVRGSMRETVHRRCSPPTPTRPRRRRHWGGSHRDRRRDRVGAGIDPHHAVSQCVRDPHRTTANRDPLAPGPTGITLNTRPAALIRDTVSSAASATHVAPSPITIRSALAGIDPNAGPLPGIRTTWETSFATHATPPPTASGLGLVLSPGWSRTPAGATNSRR